MKIYTKVLINVKIKLKNIIKYQNNVDSKFNT